MRDGRLIRNPAAGVRLPRAVVARQRFFTAAEVAALADASGRYRELVYVLAYCGLRLGEAAGLRVGDVDLTRRRLQVERLHAWPSGAPDGASGPTWPSRACQRDWGRRAAVNAAVDIHNDDPESRT
jgi:integrase